MRNKKGFTLIELLVVIAIIALLVSILMPSLTKARELAKRAACSMNLSDMGKGFAMYVGSANQDSMPWMDNQSKTWDIPTGTSADFSTPPSTSTAHAITALEFMLVRDGQNAKLFNCPSDTNAKQCVKTRDANQNYNWDFTVNTETSYGYAMPVANATSPTNGVTTNSTGSLVIMADKWVPTTTTKTYAGWLTTLTGDGVKPYMSTNHTGGEYINMLRADYSCGHDTRPNCGMEVPDGTTTPPQDNIYTAGNTAGSGNTSLPGSAVAKDQTVAAHLSADDSFVWASTPAP